MATLKDVAELAGVTVTTVSRVLNNRGYISDKTRQAVYEAMKRLDYRPNELARSLSKRRTNVIGVIVPSVAHPYFCRVVSFLEQEAARHGYKIMLCNSFHQREKEIEYIDMLKSNKVAAIVLCSRTPDIGAYLDMSLPVVTYERTEEGNVSAVSCDNYQGGTLATRHLIGKGCRRLAHISGSSEVHMPADQRCAAFLDVCREYNLTGKVFDTAEAQFLSMDYGAFLDRILMENPELDGVFASSDVIAAQLVQACARCGRRVPEDIKVVGFDDVDIAALTTPPITTIRQPVEQMCSFAVRTILQQLEQGCTAVKTVLGVTLVERGTT